MSKKTRVQEVAEVWILEEVYPYDGSTLIGVYTTATLAKQTHGITSTVKRWYEQPDTEQGGSFWTSISPEAPTQPYLIVSHYPVYAGKTP